MIHFFLVRGRFDYEDSDVANENCFAFYSGCHTTFLRFKELLMALSSNSTGFMT